MWLLLFISFGMSSCLLITLAIFGPTNSKEKADAKEKRVPEATLPIRPGTAMGSQTQSNNLPDSIYNTSIPE